MSADARPPAAIRIARPYATEDEYLEREVDTLTRTSLLLVGAEARPVGVIVRFEVALSSGQPLLRGEGRVVGYKAGAFEGQGGLTVRFTRLDVRTKALIDKAAAIRDRRRLPPSQSLVGNQGESALPGRESSPPDSLLLASVSPPPLPLARETLPLPPPSLDEPPSSDRLGPGAPNPNVDRRDRESLLARLRARARSLDPQSLAQLLKGRS